MWRTFGGGGGGGKGSSTGTVGWRNGLFVTGSFSMRPWKPLDCRLLNPNGRSFSTWDCMESGRGLFSPLTRRGEGAWITDEGRDGAGEGAGEG